MDLINSYNILFRKNRTTLPVLHSVNYTIKENIYFI